ncbi:MAG TPA: hypothetical protein VLR92_00790, partial [Blastocatellia bacterium]|nr:hypothetical protein [Blastocatellia bacterium]
MKLGISIIILLICGSASLSQAQYCNPAVVSYLVHDENGKLLSESELKTVQEQLPKSIGDADTFLGDISLAADGKSFYRPESVDFEKGKKVPALEFINAKTCTMHLTEVTLVFHEKRMRLIFNIDIARSQPNRRPVIDSLVFQEGSFELDKSGLPEGDELVP